jgi:FkbM family methyltransferase
MSTRDDIEANMALISANLDVLTSRINSLDDQLRERLNHYEMLEVLHRGIEAVKPNADSAAERLLRGEVSPASETPGETVRMVTIGQSAYLGDNVAITRTKLGHKIYVDTGDIAICSHILLDGVWEEWITSFVRRTLAPGKVFVDVGAHVGWFTLVACETVGPEGRVFAIEPQPRLASLIRSSLAVNGFSERAAVYNLALSDKRSRATLFQKPNDSGCATILGPGEGFIVQTEVDVLTLDDLMAGQTVDYIKIDAEGAEPRILRGAIRTLDANPEIQLLVEHHAGDEATMSILHNSGFVLAFVDHQGDAIPLDLVDLKHVPDATMLYLKR